MLSVSEFMSVKSDSNAVREAKDIPLLPYAIAEAPTVPENADAAQPLPSATPAQRIEDMYQLADIFASIFMTLPDEYEHAIAMTREAA